MQELLLRKQALDSLLSETFFVTLAKTSNFCVACLLLCQKKTCIDTSLYHDFIHTPCLSACNSPATHCCSALTLEDTFCTLPQLHAQKRFQYTNESSRAQDFPFPFLLKKPQLISN